MTERELQHWMNVFGMRLVGTMHGVTLEVAREWTGEREHLLYAGSTAYFMR